LARCTSFELGGTFIAPWNEFIRALKLSHIIIKDQEDELIWHLSPFGVYSPKEGYSFLSSARIQQVPDWWWKGIWKEKFPLKARLFMWCLLRKKVPTWDRMKLRGLEGSGWCSLCKGEEETYFHLFLRCLFSIQSWRIVSSVMGSSYSWQGTSIEEAWKSWVQNPRNKRIKALPLLITWGIWIARNSVIFKSKDSLPDIIVAKSLAILAHFPQEKVLPPPRHVHGRKNKPELDLGIFSMGLPKTSESTVGVGESSIFLQLIFIR
jgi:hypothetical protein